MMQKVEILDAGDTGFLQNPVVDKWLSVRRMIISWIRKVVIGRW